MGLVALFSSNLLPTFYGYIGSAAFIFIVMIFILAQAEFTDKNINLLRNVSIGLLLLLIVLIRRWYAYEVVAYFVSSALFILIYNLIKKDFDLFKTNFIRLFIQGIIPLTLLVLFFRPILLTYLTTDYSVLYAAAGKSGFFEQISIFIHHFGIYMIVLTGIPLLYNKTRMPAIFLWFNIIFTWILFTRVQNLGTHHYFIINWQMLLLVVMGMIGIGHLFSSKKITSLVLVGACCLFCIDFINTTTIKMSDGIGKFILSTMHYPFRITPEKEKIEQLAYFLHNEPLDYEYEYVLAASVLLNDDLLRNAMLPEVLDATPWMEGTHVWNQRDGLPIKFFQYTYIIVTDPVLLNGAPNEERVISILADGMLHDEELRKYYRLEWEFPYTDFNIYVYKRVEDIPNKIIMKYTEKFRNYYPDDERLYQFEMAD